MFLLTKVITNAISFIEQAVSSWFIIFSAQQLHCMPDAKSLLPQKIARIIAKMRVFF